LTCITSTILYNQIYQVLKVRESYMIVIEDKTIVRTKTRFNLYYIDPKHD